MRTTLRSLALRTGLYRVMKGSMDAVWLRRSLRRGTLSQFGEDRELLAKLGPSGLYADVGANHAYKTNNTYLLYRSGWRGLTMEPIKSHCAQHRRVRPRDVCVNAAAGAKRGSELFHELSPSGYSTFDADAAARLIADRRAVLVDRYEVPIVPLAEAWEEAFGASRPDLVSIDTEGHEAEVLAGAALDRLRPSAVLLELESAVDHDRREALIDLMAELDYDLATEYGANGLFQRRGDDSSPDDHPSTR